MKDAQVYLWAILFALFSLIPFTSIKAEEAQYEFYGRHFLAQYYGCNSRALNDPKQLAKIMKKASLAAGATVLESASHIYSPAGFSFVLLLSESHASVHTYPEHKCCFVDFFTCGRHCSAEKFDAVLRNYLQPKRVEMEIRERQ